MFLTKSLLNEFLSCPKHAWFHVHNKPIYKKIGQEQYGSIDGIAIGQEVEDMVKLFLKGKTILSPDMSKLDFSDRHNSFHKITSEVINRSPEVIYQPGFAINDLFTKSDFLVKNNEGTYDLWEVKSKNNVKKRGNGDNLLDELVYDLSFQKYVLEKGLGNLFSGKCFLVYLNKEYVKDGDIVPEQLLKIDDVTESLLDKKELNGILNLLRKYLPMEKEEFEKALPYNGESYLLYFGKNKPKDSIWTIPRIGKKVKNFYPEKTLIGKLNSEDIELLLNNKGEETKSTKFVQLWKEGKTVINKEEIQKRFDEKLKFPLYFYDYETISSPVPIFEKTRPRQQMVVQYSLHKIEENGVITHEEAIIEVGAKNNKNVVDKLVKDLDSDEGTYIVWYKGFENSRNEEMMKLYPEYKSFFERVNANTFDLMEIFSEQLYFDRGFGGSSSIKKVLPVITDISYDKLEVGHGSLASDLLRKSVKNEIDNDYDKVRKNLLEYCKLDTWAMVRIWEEVKKKL